jgi:hypothetical protein
MNIPRIIRYFWDGELTPNRIHHLGILERNSGVPLEKMSTDNMKSYEIAGDPIHPAFEYLNPSHKSDYARAYVTYHYGGGYTDVKNCPSDWNQYFNALESSGKDGIGTRLVENINGKLQSPFSETDIRYNFIGVNTFIFKKYSPVLKKWIEHNNNTLDKHFDMLKKYPGSVHPYVSADAKLYRWVPDHLLDYQYPLIWMELAGHFYWAQADSQDTTMLGMYEPQTYENGHPYR